MVLDLWLAHSKSFCFPLGVSIKTLKNKSNIWRQSQTRTHYFINSGSFFV